MGNRQNEMDSECEIKDCGSDKEENLNKIWRDTKGEGERERDRQTDRVGQRER